MRWRLRTALTSRMRTPWVLTVLLVAATATFAAACGDDADHPQSNASPAEGSGAAPRATAERIASCIRAAGFRSLLMPSPKGDADAPDYAVGFQRGEGFAGGGEVAVYASAAEASDRLPAIEASVEKLDGVVERQGSISVVFFGEPPDDVERDALGCLPGS